MTDNNEPSLERGEARPMPGEEQTESPLGYCPICRARGKTREKRPNGNDQCERGHTYPSKDALSSRPDEQAIRDQALEDAALEMDKIKKVHTVSTLGQIIRALKGKPPEAQKANDGWQPIETAPKDGTIIPCLHAGKDQWRPLRWKTNSRITTGKKRGDTWNRYLESYFGDPNEMDDYDLALPENQPTHWLKIPKFSNDAASDLRPNPRELITQ
jgi:hypothetical protein